MSLYHIAQVQYTCHDIDDYRRATSSIWRRYVCVHYSARYGYFKQQAMLFKQHLSHVTCEYGRILAPINVIIRTDNFLLVNRNLLKNEPCKEKRNKGFVVFFTPIDLNTCQWKYKHVVYLIK